MTYIYRWKMSYETSTSGRVKMSYEIIYLVKMSSIRGWVCGQLKVATIQVKFHCNTSLFLVVAARNAIKDREMALGELERRLQSQRDEALQQLKRRLEEENARLRGNLSDRTSELELSEAELKRLESELSKREKGLGSAANSMERLREELKSVRQDMALAGKEKQECTKERDKLLVRQHPTCYVPREFASGFMIRCAGYCRGFEGTSQGAHQISQRPGSEAEEGTDRGFGEQVERKTAVRP